MGLTGGIPTAAEDSVSSRPNLLSRNQQDDWLCGYAAALAAVQKLYHESSIVTGVLIGDGLTLEHLRSAGVEQVDLNQIEKAYKR